MAEKKKRNTNTQNAPEKSRAIKSKPGDDIIPSVDHSANSKGRAKKENKLFQNPDSPANQIILCIIGAVGVLLLFCLLLTNMELKGEGLTGPLGYYVSYVLYGLMGAGAYTLPIMMVVYAAMWKSSVRRSKVRSKAILSFSLTLAVSSFIHMIFHSFEGSRVNLTAFYNIPELWRCGVLRMGGGVIGGFIGGLMKTCLNVISWPIIILVMLGVIMFIFEITPNMIVYLVREGARSSAEKNKIKRQKKKGERLIKKEEERAERARREEERREEQRLENERRLEQTRLERIRLEEERKTEEQRSQRTLSDIDIDGNAKEITKESKPKTENLSREGEDNSDIMIIKRGKIRAEENAKKSQTAKEDIPTPRTVRDVDINAVFDESSKNDRRVGAISRTDLDGNDRFREEGMESFDIDMTSQQEENTDHISAVDDLFDSLEDELPPVEEAPVPAPKRVRATREKVIVEEPEDLPLAEEEEKPRYTLPPITLLELPAQSTPDGYSDEVLERNGRRLVETLRSFRVDVDITNISKGPTITRYELVPKAGVRVRSIANLVDDIALALETQGVRIEAPIPGKAAVGIEVPNKNLSTVYLRSLIDTDAFRNAKSKLNCCLGKNVSGEPIYLDIAKMPHLLIAGATGMGKSVRINSLLISLLYKATPDEVKLILIDPKKVELNVYNKLPHLLVPVVNQPKMAAGSLAWAVGEMERRFELIEEVGVRDIAGYNKVTAIDPQKEFLPQIVIVIDELADLMMTAPVDVEASIIRLAQKARAAGMHLVIGTQRPSVDVITGLIKANVPSRIAFTVASNTDSRTIIDVAGAEKLIGRGDMLYAPVGAMKPMRVQGSFVSDGEVEKVTDFIKAQITGDYSEDIIREIDKNAKQCGQKKKAEPDVEGGGAGDPDLDEKFYEAVDVAIEEGKISTSLLQRRISIGYGRAAKIIDTMQKMHIVSPPDGQKPRNTLITRQDWDEMLMRMDNPGAPSAATSEPEASDDLLEYDDDAPF